MRRSHEIDIISGPDNKGLYVYTEFFEDDNPPYCLTCGSSPEKKCACFEEKRIRSQIFKTPLKESEIKSRVKEL